MKWQSKSNPPPTPDDSMLYCLRSVPVLGFFRSKKKAVVIYQKDPEEGTEKWFTDDSEGWNVTEDIVAWQYLPDDPPEGFK
jgi:hypothetical protein